MGGPSPTPTSPPTRLPPAPLSTKCACRLFLYIKWLRRQSLAARAMAVRGPGEGKWGVHWANSSLSCRLPVVSQCPLGRWGISCSWRATGPHRVGERDAYRVGAWKRRENPGQGEGGPGLCLELMDTGYWGHRETHTQDHWGTGQRGVLGALP